ncbi:MAG: hypothetical protein KC431_11065, partial [Myxococcales bacterium]|nr:hypothetical protein [Myxococcales bacterium]
RAEQAERRAKREQQRREAGESGERRREPPTPVQRYVMPFVKEIVVMGVPAGATLIVVALARRLRRRKGDRRGEQDPQRTQNT